MSCSRTGDDWVADARAHWREERVRALETLASVLSRVGRHALAVAAARSATSLEPYRDRSRGALIKAYLAEGNPGQAVAEYRRYEALLERELGVPPHEALRELALRGWAVVGESLDGLASPPA